MHMKSLNEYFAKSKGVLLYDKHFNLSRWKTRWKVWKIQRIFKAFEPVLRKIRKGISLYVWKTLFLNNYYHDDLPMNIQ